MADNRSYERGVCLDVDVSGATFPGDNLTSGEPLLLGSIPGVALTDADASDIATVQLGEGVFELEVTGEITAIGSAVYIASTGALNVTTSNDLFGFAMETKAAAAGTIAVKLAPYSNNVAAT